jgi:hypothetical protein
MIISAHIKTRVCSHTERVKQLHNRLFSDTQRAKDFTFFSLFATGYPLAKVSAKRPFFVSMGITSL